MDYRTFFTTKVMMSFFVSVVCITLAMGLFGILFEPNARFGYEAFFSPLLFGALATLPMQVTYSKRELSVVQTATRNIIHFVLLEAVILTTLLVLDILNGYWMTISMGVSISIIYASVHAILWLHDSRVATQLNGALRTMQNTNVDIE